MCRLGCGGIKWLEIRYTDLQHRFDKTPDAFPRYLFLDLADGLYAVPSEIHDTARFKDGHAVVLAKPPAAGVIHGYYSVHHGRLLAGCAAGDRSDEHSYSELGERQK
ncbi:MAG TPA: hypothetical protein VLL94_06995 [Nitrospiraceae bacterium]|nr:hypothetical protein [Nitrospiraceae bacterium]